MLGATRARHGYLYPITALAYRRLQDDAARMIESAVADPTDGEALEKRQAHRHVALKAAVHKQGIIGRIGQTFRPMPGASPPRRAARCAR